MNNSKTDFNKVSGTFLQIDTYDKNGDCVIIHFEVPTDWLISNINMTLQEFLDTYTSDESSHIYALAKLEEKIVCELDVK